MNQLSVWRVRGWMPHLVYGVAYDHHCREPERFEPDLDLLYRQGQGMGMW